MDLFDGDPSLGLDADLIETMREAYRQKLLDNPPTPAFMPTNPKCEAAARYASRRDIDRFLAVLGELGYRIVRAEG